MQGLEHTPTSESRSVVSGRKAQGCTNEQIAEYFDISADTLAKHYAVEIRTAKPLFMDTVYKALEKRIAEGSDKLITLCLTHQGGWKSSDKQAEVDATKDLTAAIEKKTAADALTAQLRGHLAADAAIIAETSQDERS